MTKNNITLSKEDRIELLRHIHSLDRMLEETSETFDLHLSDLRNLSELQWTLIRKLNFTQNDDKKTKYIKPFILKEDEDEDEKGDS
jgi:hypothetical protein|tara:strand:+ start:231 stop:488 length:258 start_codon:yes stop_codon:yes gene_type:complete